MAQNEGTADANAIVCLDGDVPIAARQYADHPQYQDLVAALKSRSYGGNLTVKKEILLKFRPSELDDVEKYCRDPDLYKHFFRHLLDHLHRNTLNKNQIKKNLTTTFVAEGLAELYVLDQWNKEFPDNRRQSRQDPSIMVKKAFASLSELVDTVLVAYSDDRKKKGGRSKVNLQASGTRVQDTKPFDSTYCDSEECPNCSLFIVTEFRVVVVFAIGKYLVSLEVGSVNTRDTQQFPFVGDFKWSSLGALWACRKVGIAVACSTKNDNDAFGSLVLWCFRCLLLLQFLCLDRCCYFLIALLIELAL